jgi:hypothetical protein
VTNDKGFDIVDARCHGLGSLITGTDNPGARWSEKFGVRKSEGRKGAPGKSIGSTL